MTESTTDIIAKSEKAHSYIISFIKPPIQRQKWSDDQVLPHTNWGDLFFDLFYVGAAYNLANILKYDPTFEGLLYFIGCFATVYHNFWTEKTYYDSRFSVGDDIVHLLCDVIQLAFLATAVSNIQPVEYMSHVKDYPQMFLFCLFNLLGMAMGLLRIIEIGFIWVDGQDAARFASRTQVKQSIPSFILALIATIYAGVLYYGNDSNTYQSNERLLASSKDSSSDGFVSHLPIAICATQLIMKPLNLFINIICFSGSDFKSRSVPINIDFSIHRYGEFNMLMLGESVLSLLLVKPSILPAYQISFYVGVLSVIILQLLHYKSQPKHADDHAMRRSRLQGCAFFTLTSIYSAALILVGVSYKMILTEHTDEFRNEKNEVRNLYVHNSFYQHNRQVNPYTKDIDRFLASGGGGSLYTYSGEERHQRISNLFCAGLATVFLCHSFMMLSHQDLKNLFNRCHQETCPVTNRKGSVSKVTIFLLFCNGAIIIFIATLSSYVNNPTHVAVFGLVAIVGMVSLRILGSVYFLPLSKVSSHRVERSGYDDENEM